MANNRWILAVFGFSAALALGAGARAGAADLPPLAGTWTWSWVDGAGRTHHHVLEVEGVKDKLAAREVFDTLPPVRVENLVQDGTKVRFTVVRGDRRAEYNGVVDAPNSIRGKVTVSHLPDGPTTQYDWNAGRQTKPKLPPQPAPTDPEG